MLQKFLSGKRSKIYLSVALLFVGISALPGPAVWRTEYSDAGHCAVAVLKGRGYNGLIKKGLEACHTVAP